jgi:hypothetical protein
VVGWPNVNRRPSADTSAANAARILRICERAADERVASGDSAGAAQLLGSAASQFPCSASPGLLQKAASLDAAAGTPYSPTAVHDLAEQNSTVIAIRKQRLKTSS